MSKPYAEVIGDPIAHSKSPLIHRFWLAKLGIDADYRARRVLAGELADYFAQRREDPDWCGCNVTVPHKQAVVPLLDRLGPLCTQIGAVNVVIPDQGLVGGNSDIEGITRSLPFTKEDKLQQACMIGSGGAALAAMAAFRLLGAARVTLNVRNRAKGEALLASWKFDGRVGGVDDGENIANSQLIINASTLGMNGQAAMPESLLAHVRCHPDDEAIVFDMVYAPIETALLAAARQRGLRIVDGLMMLVNQAAVAFQAFFGAPAPREHDAELRALLTS